MAFSTIDKSTLYQNNVLYTGNASTNAITGVGFQPDWVWTKDRDATYDHMSWDAVRGATKRIKPNETAAENTQSDGLTAFGADGFTMGADNGNNASGDDFVSWNWKANGAGSANTVGDIDSTVSVNTTAGFSIVTYTGNGSAGATVGHGLGAVPKMILVKNLDATENWSVYHNSLGNTDFLRLNQNNATTASTTIWNDTTPTSSVFTVGSGASVNGSGNDLIAYCFTEISGYSRFGLYYGNGVSNSDGSFIYTGFKPSFIMVKRTN